MRKKFTLKKKEHELTGIPRLNKGFRVVLVKALSRMPREVAEWAAEKLIFSSESGDAKALFLNKEGWGRKRGFIFFSNALMDESEDAQTFMVAHEIAHIKLNHRSLLLNPDMAEEDMIRQETEADALAEKWLAPF